MLLSPLFPCPLSTWTYCSWHTAQGMQGCVAAPRPIHSIKVRASTASPVCPHAASPKPSEVTTGIPQCSGKDRGATQHPAAETTPGDTTTVPLVPERGMMH